MRWLLLIGILFHLRPAHAIFLETNYFYFSDNFAATSTNVYGRTFYDICIGISMTNNDRALLGWNYSSINATDSIAGAATTFTSSQMGPRFLFFLNRAKSWLFGAAYNIVTTGAYTTGGASTTLSGTALKADLGYSYWVSETFYLGPRMNYSSTTFTSSVSGTTITQTTTTRAFIYPTFYLNYNF